MDPFKLATALIISLGIILFLLGMVTPTDEEAYEEYNKTKKGISPRVQKFRLMGGGVVWIIMGIIFYFRLF